eukprot:TRINITY_DN4898_c0_g1_i2.p1 TRINITY_DN4898_c0_g1~~TRINITY_DN4898_c0_g1_i2.p1  ORF type:complete len:336 (+),score=93.87 TRINITY_DN4898_c0_g1_i2:409-1416(+)
MAQPQTEKRKPGNISTAAAQALQAATREQLHTLLGKMFVELGATVPHFKERMESVAVALQASRQQTAQSGLSSTPNISQPQQLPGGNAGNLGQFGGQAGLLAAAGGANTGLGGLGAFGGMGMQQAGGIGDGSIFSAAGIQLQQAGLGGTQPSTQAAPGQLFASSATPGRKDEKQPHAASPARGAQRKDAPQFDLSAFFQGGAELAAGTGRAAALEGMTLEPEGETSFDDPFATAGTHGFHQEAVLGALGDFGLGASDYKPGGTPLRMNAADADSVIKQFIEKVDLAGIERRQTLNFSREDAEEFAEMYFFDPAQVEIIWRWLGQQRAQEQPGELR